MKVAICSAEVFPFSKTGGLADVCGALPLALERLGVEVDVFLPHYRGVDDQGYAIEKIDRHLAVTTVSQALKVYFITNNGHFDREGLYGDPSGDYPDNLERFKFYCIHVLKALKVLQDPPDIIHCHDWQTALIPVYLKEHYGQDPFYASIKTMVTIHNLAFQGVFAQEEYSTLELPGKLFTPDIFEFYDQVNLLKAGIVYADKVSTVSPQYAQEIQGPERGCGLDAVLRHAQGEVTGILNGLDYSVWSPATDALIEARYSAQDYASVKPLNKANLQQQAGLPVTPQVPVMGFVGRLSHQKGVDLIMETLETMMPAAMQVIIQGVGDEEYSHRLTHLAQRYPEHVAVILKFDESLAHQIYAGSDMFLMPSCFEPCGLSQMISLAYGTVPIVFKTGGLADTITPFTKKAQTGNGFVFEQYTAKAFIACLQWALTYYDDSASWATLVANGFASRFPWDASARAYKDIYQALC